MNGLQKQTKTTKQSTKTFQLHCLYICLLRDFINKFKETTSILVGMHGGYFSCRAVLHSLGSLCSSLLDAVAGQNVNDANEV